MILSNALGSNKSLRELDLDNTPIQKGFLNFLTSNRTLKHLRLRVLQKDIFEIIDVLKENRGLETLDILNQRYSDEAIDQLRTIQNMKIYFYDDRN